MARIPRANHATSPQYIYERKEFQCNSMSGMWRTSWTGVGELSGTADETLFREHEREGEPMYVVFSYSTPIAWWTERHGWHKVEQKFSPTTSKHQGRLYLV